MSSLRALISLVCLLAALPGRGEQPDPRKGLGQGAGDLMILPTRIVLEGRQRSGEVMLKNQGKTPATYRIFFKEMDMSPSGQLQDRVKAPGETTAADLVRYTPRQVELAPGEAQTVRIQVRKPEGLPEGEYRSHLVFQGIPPAEVPQPEDGAAEQKLSITIRPVYGISIPVILRHGETRASISFEKLAYVPPATPEALPLVTLSLARQGNRSVLGDFEVTLDRGGSLKKGTPLALAKGLAVYPCIAAREISLPLQLDKGASLKGARLKIAFTPVDLKLAPSLAFLELP